MKIKEAMKIVKKALPKFKEVLCLGQYTITILSNNKLTDEKERNAECRLWPEYKKEQITFDFKVIKSKKELLDALWHELLHAVLMEFDAYKNQVLYSNCYGAEDRREWMLNKCFNDCHERTVKHLQLIIKQPKIGKI